MNPPTSGANPDVGDRLDGRHPQNRACPIPGELVGEQAERDRHEARANQRYDSREINDGKSRTLIPGSMLQTLSGVNQAHL